MTWNDLKDHDVAVYSTTWCGDCRRLKHILAANGIGYREIDIDADADAAAELRQRTGRGAIPYVLVAGKAMVRGWHDEHPMRWHEATFLAEVEQALQGPESGEDHG